MRRPPRWATALAAAWFALAGAVSGLFAVSGAWTAVSAGLNGCVLSIEGVALTFPVASDPLECSQRVDMVTIVVGGLASLALLMTLVWLTGARRGRRWVPLGAVASVLVGLQPMLLVTWLIERGNLTGGPIELGVGLVPLVWSVVSAIVALAAWRASTA